MKKRTYDLSSLIFYALIILLVLLAITNYLTSFLYARYLSSDDDKFGANVAEWEINFDDGGEINRAIPSTHLEYGSNGEYGLDIVNSSDTFARINPNSNVKLRLYSPNLNLEHHHDSWDFLEDNLGNHIDNPINFQVYLYNCSYKTLTENYLNDGQFDNSVQLPGMSVEEYLILDTGNEINPLNFEMVIEQGVFYYETVVLISSLTDNFDIAYNGGRICLRVVWNVDVVSGSVDTNSNYISYHMVKLSEFDNNKYVGILNKLNLQKINLESSSIANIETSLGNNCITIEGVKYVIAYKEHDYFEYLIYTSSLGGEVMITFDNLEGIYIKKFTKLSNEEKTLLNGRSIADATTVEGLSRFIEKLEYASYQEFLTTKSEYEKISGYVSLGIQCNIIINFKVEQID